MLAPRIGRTIDAVGGRGVLAASNLVLALGLVILGVAQNPYVMLLGWMAMGLGMSLGLYDSAFATLGRIYGASARSAITGVTLIAGFASTVGWPLSAWGLTSFGWRETCFAWAAAHLLIGAPANRFLLPKAEPLTVQKETGAKPHIPMDRTMIMLALSFSLVWMVTAAMASHLPRLLQAAGASASEAIAAAALVGPAQVAARLLEAGFLSRFHPLLSARLAAMTHPIGAATLGLMVGGGLAAAVFAVLHGLGNGVLTIARGAVPLAIYGPENYGYRLGLLGAPARTAQAAAPFLFGLLIDQWGTGVLFISAGMSLAALLAMAFIRPPEPKVD
jgi:MFS family permease